MTLTMMVSGHNFGNQKSLGIYLTGFYGWENVALVGLIMQLVAITVFPIFFKKA